MKNLKLMKKIGKINFITNISKKKNKNMQNSIKSDDTLYYCSYCSKLQNYSDLIDGCRCHICDNDLFIILWDEYKKSIPRVIKNKKIFIVL